MLGVKEGVKAILFMYVVALVFLCVGLYDPCRVLAVWLCGCVAGRARCNCAASVRAFEDMARPDVCCLSE